MTTQKPTDKALRSTEDRADRARPSYMDKFKKFEELERNTSGTLRVKNLPKDLHAHLATADPKHVAKIVEKGFIPLEDVQSELGDTPDGNYVGEAGTNVKWYVCSQEVRQQRHEENVVRNKKVDRALYQDDKEAPVGMHRDIPPDDYIPGN